MSILLDRVASVFVWLLFALVGAAHILFGLALLVAGVLEIVGLPMVVCGLLAISFGVLLLWWSVGGAGRLLSWSDR